MLRAAIANSGTAAFPDGKGGNAGVRYPVQELLGCKMQTHPAGMQSQSAVVLPTGPDEGGETRFRTVFGWTRECDGAVGGQEVDAVKREMGLIVWEEGSEEGEELLRGPAQRRYHGEQQSFEPAERAEEGCSRSLSRRGPRAPVRARKASMFCPRRDGTCYVQETGGFWPRCKCLWAGLYRRV